MKVLCIDCFSGISGDMMVGALIDAGASYEKIKTELGKLNISGYTLHKQKVVKVGISATKFDVILEEEDHHHHDHAHHTHDHGQPQHPHSHDHSHIHTHHGHRHDHQHDHHHHRSYADIVELIEKSDLHPNVKERSKAMFAPIAAAEAKIHHMRVADVHFHEVGAVDSIVDIVATAIALEDLNIEKIITSHVPLGSGQLRMAHGIYPIPAPATLEMMKQVPIAATDLPFELTTPTGAGIVVSQSDSFGHMPAMTVTSIGYGAGTRNIPERPNVLRVIIGELLEKVATPSKLTEMITVLECQLDDMTGEQYGFVMEQLLAEGALDVYFTPVFMKKNRTGTLITVLAPNELEAQLTEILLKETTTLGVRKNKWTRSILERNIKTVKTAYGLIRVKQAIHNGTVIREIPEYEDVKKAALEHHESYQTVYQAALKSK